MSKLLELFAKYWQAPIVDQYARKKSQSPELFNDEGNARWVTIGGEPGPDGKRVGGRPVLIGDDGKMKSGHFAGQTMGQAFGGKSESKPEPKQYQGDRQDAEPKGLASMSQEQLAAHINKQKGDSLMQSRQEDWGNSMRGQGKRMGGMVRGAMSSPPRGVKTYTSLIGKLEGEERQEAGLLDTHEQHAYVKAREAGLDHGAAMIWAWESYDESLKGKTLEAIKNPETKPQATIKPPEQPNSRKKKVPVREMRDAMASVADSMRSYRSAANQKERESEFARAEKAMNSLSGITASMSPYDSERLESLVSQFEDLKSKHATSGRSLPKDELEQLKQAKENPIKLDPVFQRMLGKSEQAAKDDRGEDGKMKTGKFAGQSMGEAFGSTSAKAEPAQSESKPKQFEPKILGKPDVPAVGTRIESKNRPGHTINQNLHSHLTGEKKAVRDLSEIPDGAGSASPEDRRRHFGLSDNPKQFEPKVLGSAQSEPKSSASEAQGSQEHLSALEHGLFNEEKRLRAAKTDNERRLRQVWVDQLKSQITNEKRLLGISESADASDELSDDELLSQLSGSAPTSKPKPAAPGTIQETRSNEQARSGDQMGLFGEVSNVPGGKPTLKGGGETRGRVQNLFDTKGTPDQMMMFDDGVTPSELVLKAEAGGQARPQQADPRAALKEVNTKLDALMEQSNPLVQQEVELQRQARALFDQKLNTRGDQDLWSQLNRQEAATRRKLDKVRSQLKPLNDQALALKDEGQKHIAAIRESEKQRNSNLYAPIILERYAKKR